MPPVGMLTQILPDRGDEVRAVLTRGADLQSPTTTLGDANHRGRLEGVNVAGGIHSQLIVAQRVQFLTSEEPWCNANLWTAGVAVVCCGPKRSTYECRHDRDARQVEPSECRAAPRGLHSLDRKSTRL